LGLGGKSEKPPAARRSLRIIFASDSDTGRSLPGRSDTKWGRKDPATDSFTARAVPRMFGNNMEVFLEVERGFEDETFNLVPPVGSSIDYSLRGAEAQRVINAVDDFVASLAPVVQSRRVPLPSLREPNPLSDHSVPQLT